MKLNYFFLRKKIRIKLVHVFPLCDGVPHCEGEENLIHLDILSNPSFFSSFKAFLPS